MFSKPCDWPVEELTEEEQKASPLFKLTEARRTAVIEMATSLLWAWTGRRFGLCAVSVRPCRAEAAKRNSTFWGPMGVRSGIVGWLDMPVDGLWLASGCGVCADVCACGSDTSRTLVLPGSPHSVTAIYIGGKLLPASAYELRDRVLYRLDGEAWPSHNDEVADPQAEGSTAWEVRYMRGRPVPLGGQLSARMLAEQLAKAMIDDPTCALPDNVKSVTRQGVNMEMSTTDYRETKEGRTGVFAIDSWVASMNAPRSTATRVYSPDLRGGRASGTSRGLGVGGGRTW